MTTATVHASAVLVGSRATLIRGPSGSGKSQLALALLEAMRTGSLRFSRLVADDRVEIEASHGRLLLRPPPSLAGLLEIRGLGIREIAWEPVAVAGLVVDLAAADADRMPTEAAQWVDIAGIRLPRLPVAVGVDAIAAVLSALHTHAANGSVTAMQYRGKIND